MIDKPGRSIPIVLAPARSGAQDDFIGRPPATMVHIAIGDNTERDGESYWAIIDTGGDCTAIDSSIATRLNAPLEGNGIAHGYGNPVSGVRHTPVSIIFPTVNVTFFNPKTAVLDFRASGQRWDVLLGRDFLSCCRFQVDGPNGIYRLEWVG